MPGNAVDEVTATVSGTAAEEDAAAASAEGEEATKDEPAAGLGDEHEAVVGDVAKSLSFPSVKILRRSSSDNESALKLPKAPEVVWATYLKPYPCIVFYDVRVRAYLLR